MVLGLPDDAFDLDLFVFFWIWFILFSKKRLTSDQRWSKCQDGMGIQQLHSKSPLATKHHQFRPFSWCSYPGGIFAAEWENLVAISSSTFRVCKDGSKWKWWPKKDMLKDFFVCLCFFFPNHGLKIPQFTWEVPFTHRHDSFVWIFWGSEAPNRTWSPPFRCWSVRNPFVPTIKMLDLKIKMLKKIVWTKTVEYK